MREQHRRGHVGEDLRRSGAVAEQKAPAGVESADRHQIRRMVGNRAEQRVTDRYILDDDVVVARVDFVAGEVGDQKVGEFVALLIKLTFPLTAPAAVGANWTVTGMDWPAFKVSPELTPLTV